MDKPLVTAITKCRACQSDKLTTILNLGATPLADSFPTDINKLEQNFSLELMVCNTCWLVQLKHTVDSSLLFGEDYSFFAGASPSSVKYFQEYADSVIRGFPNQCKEGVLEIASNDGTLLEHFQKKYFGVLGIDPAGPPLEVANQKGVKTIPEFFTLNLAKKLAKEGKKGVIIANNVVAHVEDLNDFMGGVKELLSDDGVFIMECQYLPNLLFRNQFDNIYHEHRCFFSLIPLLELLRSHGLGIVDVQETSTQGGSIRVFIRHFDKHPDVSENTALMYGFESQVLKLNQTETYMGLQARADFMKIELRKLLYNLKAQGKKVYGYGASAKSCTLLNFCGIDSSLIKCVVDKTPYKIGKHTPGSHIPIIGDVNLITPVNNGEKPDYYLLLVWNYLTGILEREKGFRAMGGKFILPNPMPIVI